MIRRGARSNSPLPVPSNEVMRSPTRRGRFLPLVPVMTTTFAREFVSVSVLRCDHGCDRLVDMRLRAGCHCIGQHHRWRAGPFAQFIECLL
jgi:hypothetical protein